MRPELNDKKVYVAKDPDSMDIVYVGVTSKSLKERLKAHRGCKSPGFPEYVRNLHELGKSPVMEFVEIIDPKDDWQSREMYWIYYFKSRGSKLMNLTNGGFGARGMKWNENQRKVNKETHSVPVYTLNENTLEVLKFDSMTDFANHIGVTEGTVSTAVQKGGKRKGFYISLDPEKFKINPIANNYRTPIVAICPDGNELEFCSAYTAANELGLDRSAVRRVVIGDYKQFKGYRFRLAKNNKLEKAGFLRLQTDKQG